MLGRSYQGSEDYRYGFNGMEKDDEVKGDANSLDFGARIYDPRIGRWLGIDPQYYRAAGHSPYNFAQNNPIYFIDSDGEWVKIHTTRYYKNEEGDLKVKKWYHINKNTVFIEKKITAGNFKLYAHGATADQLSKEQLEQGAKSMQEQLMKHYNQTVEGEEGDPDIELSFTFVNYIDVIEDLDDVNLNGKMKDDLIIIVPDVSDYIEKMGVAASLDDNIMIVEKSALRKSSTTVPHEFQHQHDGITDDPFTRPRDESHWSGGIKGRYDKTNIINWDNANELGPSLAPVGQSVYKRIKKEARKENQQDESPDK